MITFCINGHFYLGLVIAGPVNLEVELVLEGRLDGAVLLEVFRLGKQLKL